MNIINYMKSISIQPLVESTIVYQYPNNVRSIKNIRTSSIQYETKIVRKESISRDATYRFIVSAETTLSSIPTDDIIGTTYRLRYAYNGWNMSPYIDAIVNLHITYRTELGGRSYISIEIETPSEYPTSTMDSIVKRIYSIHNGWDVPNLAQTISSMRDVLRDMGIKGPDDLQIPYDIRYPDLTYQNMITRRHAVSFKADGIRMLYVVSPVGTFLATSTINIVPLDIHISSSTYILDGELQDNTYWVFDIICSMNHDTTTMSYIDRYDMANNAIQSIHRVDPITISIKPIRVPSNADEFFSAIEWTKQYTEENSIPTDGIILTGIDQIYSNNIYKWKDPSLMSIDFFVGYNNGTISLATYNRGSMEWHIEYRSDDDLLEHIGTVCEFQYVDGIVWRYIRTRYDKIRPNSTNVLNAILSLHRDPITWDVITGRSLSLMRKYHNRVKRAVYDLLDADTITDIGSGKGGDLSSWVRNKMDVIAIEPDKNNVDALLSRIQDATVEYVDDTSPPYYEIQGQCWSTTLYPMKVEDYVKTNIYRTDALTLFNSITFLDDDTLCTLINECVHDTGTIVLMLMDGVILQDMFLNGRDSYTSSLINIERVDCNGQTSITNNGMGNLGCIYIRLNDSSTVSNGQVEGLIDGNVVLSILRQSGWSADIDMYLTQEKLLGREERMYSSAQRLLVLRRVSIGGHIIRQSYIPIAPNKTYTIDDSPWGSLVRVGVLDGGMSMTYALLQAYDQSYRELDNISKTIIATSRRDTIVKEILDNDIPIYIIPSINWNMYYKDPSIPTVLIYPARGGVTMDRKAGIVLMNNRDHWEPIAKKTIGKDLQYIW